MAEIEIPVVTTKRGEGGIDSGDIILNHVSSLSVSQAEKLGEEFDDESPLMGEERVSSIREDDQYLDMDSSSAITAPLVVPMPVQMTVQLQPLSQGGATPLIILPVQSEGIPTSGSLPLGRGESASPPTPPNEEELKKVLSQQLEYYFSKDNLSSDKYLLSQMDGDNYVPVSVISHFNQVRKLTTDMTLILESLRASSVLQLDEGEEKVRAIPEKRCVLILREIPKETSKQAIVDLFDEGNCPNCVTCEFADNNCWYVTFDSETSTQQAYSYLREEVREFLGQPIRARIKGTTVQRSSGMPKAKHTPFSMQSGPFNGGPPQMPYYQAQPTGMLPWSPTPPIASAPFYDHGNFNHFVANGFTPPQQGTVGQVGVTNQGPGAGGPTGGFSGNRYNFPYSPTVRGEGERDGRGRMGLPNRYNRGSDGGHSPPSTTVPNGDAPPPVNMEQSDKVELKGGQSSRGEHHAGGVGGGVVAGGGGGKYDRKIPRLKHARYGSRGNQGGDTERGNEKNQIPPRQQAKQPQPKLDLATAHFPPLPTSDSGATPTLALPPATTHAHISEDGQKTLSDIVKGNGRPITKETVVGDAPALVASADGIHAAVASSVVEKSIASAAAKISLSRVSSGVSGTTSPPRPAPTVTTTSEPSTITSQQDTTPQRNNMNSDPSQPPLSSSVLVGKSSQEVSIGSTSTASRVVTSSSVVANGAPPSHQGATNVATTKPTPNSTGQKSLKNDTKINNKDRQYNKGYVRHSDKDASSSKNRNSQVQKGDGRSALTTNPRNRHKVEKEFPSKNRPGNGTRPPHSKPSPKSSKKNISPHSSQAPPTLSANSTTGTENSQASDSSAKLDTTQASKPERLSYAQMAQKKNSAAKSGEGDSSSTEGGSKVTSPGVTTPPASVVVSPQSKTVKSTSISSISVSSQEGQSGAPAPPPLPLSKSAPVSPTKQSGSVVRVKENEV